MIKLYTDGSCIKNPDGPGGWCVCLLENNQEIILSDKEDNTTNNRMELTAVIEGISMLKEHAECILYSDSMLTINCCIGKWKRKANLDLWSKYEEVSKNKKITFEWVKAHNGDKYNELVDKIAYNEAKSVIKY